MEKMNAEILNEFRLVKILYEHDIKSHNLFVDKMNKDCKIAFKLLYSFPFAKVRRRNIVADWVWAPQTTIENVLNLIRQHEIRFRLTDHTETYYRQPEKLSALRSEVDQWMENNVDVDTVLDRVGQIGLDGISKTEREILHKKSKSL